jgi:hypothetical protein
MKKGLIILMALWFSLNANSQVSISQLPTYTGSPSGGYVPIVIGGSTKKIDASKFGSGVDSNRLAFLAKNNNFTGSVDTFTSITVNNSYGIDNTGAGAFNGISCFDDAYISGGLHLGGYNISAISNDGTLSSNSANLLPTQQAVKTYVDANRPYKVLSGWINSTDTSTYTFTEAQDDFNSTYTISKVGTGVLRILSSTSVFSTANKFAILTSGFGDYVGFNYTPFQTTYKYSSGTIAYLYLQNNKGFFQTPVCSYQFIEIRVYP